MNYKGEATAIRITEYFIKGFNKCEKCLSSRSESIDNSRCYLTARGFNSNSMKSNFVQDIDPIALCKYFERNGWESVKCDSKHEQFYKLIKDGNLRQIAIPFDKGVFDYPHMMCNAVEMLAIQQGKCFVKMMLIALRLSDETKGEDK